MTKIKLCGLTNPCDIEIANKLHPDYIGFVFWSKSRRCVSKKEASELKKLLSPDIKAVGVFVDEDINKVVELLKDNIIDIAQLHGNENDDYINKLRSRVNNPVIKAFRIKDENDIAAIESCNADYVLLDSGAGSGNVFNWEMIKNVKRQYFLAGGLDVNNVAQAIKKLHPYAVDVSSGIETDGAKDKNKTEAFVAAVRKEDAI